MCHQRRWGGGGFIAPYEQANKPRVFFFSFFFFPYQTTVWLLLLGVSKFLLRLNWVKFMFFVIECPVEGSCTQGWWLAAEGGWFDLSTECGFEKLDFC